MNDVEKNIYCNINQILKPMKTILSFLSALLFTISANAQTPNNRFTIELQGGLSVAMNEEYWGDNYADVGPTSGLKIFYNTQKKLSFGLEVNFTSHSFYAQGLADDLMEANSREFNLTPKSTSVVADPYLHLLALACLKFNQPLGQKFILDFGAGLGVNSFATPIVNSTIKYNDPDDLNYTRVTSIYDSFGYAFALKVDAGIAYKIGQRWNARFGFQYVNSTELLYDTTVYSTEFDDVATIDKITTDVEVQYPASWLNFTLGVAYSFGKRE